MLVEYTSVNFSRIFEAYVHSIKMSKNMFENMFLRTGRVKQRAYGPILYGNSFFMLLQWSESGAHKKKGEIGILQ